MEYRETKDFFVLELFIKGTLYTTLLQIVIECMNHNPKPNFVIQSMKNDLFIHRNRTLS
jgi:hypothetical protein